MAVKKKVVSKKAPAKARKKPAKARRKSPAKPRRKAVAPRNHGGGAPLGNQFWKMRSRHGPKPVFETAAAMWDACEEYFQWVIDNPLQEEKLFTFQGDVIKGTINKMRAMTFEGLYTFLDIGSSTWHEYRSREDFRETVERVERVIRDYKFTGAAADLLNPIIIARDLGLRDGMEHTGAGGGPISGVLAIPTAPEDWATIAQAHQNALKQDAG